MSEQHATPLKFLIPGWFSVVMGLCGLALAWARAVPVLGDVALTGSAMVGSLAALVLLVLTGLSLVRMQRYPQAFAEDFSHPVRHVFVAAFPVSLILMSAVLNTTLGVSLLAQAIWIMGALLQLMVTVWVLSRWLKIAEVGKPTNAFWPGITPALLIPVVGNVVVPLAGVKLGFAEWSAAQFGIGLFFWLVVMALLIVRLGQHGIWPQRLLPTTFITVAPPSIIGSAIIALGAPTTLSWMAWGVAVFFLLWSGTFAKQIVGSPFAITFWAMSFPLASFCALTLRLSEFAPSWFGIVASGLLVIVSLLIIMLLVGTVNGLRKGTLLAPEPGANVAPAAPAPV